VSRTPLSAALALPSLVSRDAVCMYDLRTNLVRWETNVRNGVCSIEFDRKDIEMNKLARHCLYPPSFAHSLVVFSLSVMMAPGAYHPREPVQSVRHADVLPQSHFSQQQFSFV
jgi:hypothetical protein